MSYQLVSAGIWPSFFQRTEDVTQVLRLATFFVHHTSGRNPDFLPAASFQLHWDCDYVKEGMKEKPQRTKEEHISALSFLL